MVKTFLDAVPFLYQTLEPATSPLLIKIRDLCRPGLTETVKNLIYQDIIEDVTYVKSALDLRNQRTFAVKVGSYSRIGERFD